MRTYLDIIHTANTANPKDYQSLYINEERIGFLRIQQYELMNDYGFKLSKNTRGYQWVDASTLMSENTTFIEKITKALYRDHFLETWRDEQYALSNAYHKTPQALVERAVMPIFGGCGYGVHINGLVQKHDGIYMWISQRANDKAIDPNKFDQIAAGGTPWGISSFNNMQKECFEEAGISRELSQQAIAVGINSYCYEVEYGIRADVMFNYDLWLPESFQPYNTDGEAQAFHLIPLQDIPDLLLKDDQVKFNSALVMIDCLIRYGIINEYHKDYEKICEGLRYRNLWISHLEK